MTFLNKAYTEAREEEKIAQHIYNLLTAKGFLIDGKISTVEVEGFIEIDFYMEGYTNATPDAIFYITGSTVEIEIYSVCLKPVEIAKIAEQAQMFANFTTFD